MQDAMLNTMLTAMLNALIHAMLNAVLHAMPNAMIQKRSYIFLWGDCCLRSAPPLPLRSQLAG